MVTTTQTVGRYVPHIMLVSAAVIYGSLFSLNKIVAESGLPPIGYAFWQSLCAGTALWIIAVMRGSLPGWSWPHLRAYLVIGGLAIGIPAALLTHAAPHLPAGILTLVLALSPPLTYLLSIVVRIDRYTLLGGLGVIFGFAGVALLVGPRAALPEPEMVGWFLLSLTAPVCFATGNVLVALLRPPAATAPAMAGGILLGSAAIVAPFMVATGQVYVPNEINAGELALLAAAGVIGVFVILYIEIVRLAGPTFFAQFNYLAVFSGIAWGAVIFDERLSLIVWLALALMAVGVILTSIKDRFTSPRSPSP